MANKTWKLTATGDLSVSGNWSPSAPAAGDNVNFPAGSPDITAGLTALSTATLSGALGAVIFEGGNGMNVGSSAAPMKFTCSRFEGRFVSGQQFFDLEASAIIPRVSGGSAPPGQYGLYIKGSALTSIDALGGSIAVGGLSFETATATAIRCIGSDVTLFIGEGVSLTTLEVVSGNVELRCAATTVTVYSPATLTTWGTGAITTLNNYGGTVVPNSTGTIATLNATAGTTDFTQSSVPRTITNYNPSGTATVKIDPAYITITTPSNPSTRYSVSYSTAA